MFGISNHPSKKKEETLSPSLLFTKQLEHMDTYAQTELYPISSTVVGLNTGKRREEPPACLPGLIQKRVVNYD